MRSAASRMRAWSAARAAAHAACPHAARRARRLPRAAAHARVAARPRRRPASRGWRPTTAPSASWPGSSRATSGCADAERRGRRPRRARARRRQGRRPARRSSTSAARSNEHELEVMREHTVVGQRMLAACERLRDIAGARALDARALGRLGLPGRAARRGHPARRAHHRRLRRLRRDDERAPVPARRARAHEALAELRRGAGRRYDPRIVPVFLAAVARLSGRGRA